MMSEDNNMVPLATPTRFLIESGEWNLTPNLGSSIHNEVNPFDCVKPNEKWSPPSPVVNTTTIYTASPEPELNMTATPPTPPMTLSQSPSSTSTSLSLNSEPMSASSPVKPTNMIQPQRQLPAQPPQPPQPQMHHSQQQQVQYAEQTQPQPTPRRTSSRQSKQSQSSFFSDYLQDDEVDQRKPKTASVQSGRKRRIVFEGDDAEDRRKKFLERNRVAAYKCRQKKKNWMQDLEQKAEIQNSHNEKLRAVVAQLKEESMYLRNLLLTHGNCDCDSVQSYLKRTSAKISYNTTTSMSMSSRRSSFAYPQPAPPHAMPTHSDSFSTIPSFADSSCSTGLTPFLNTVINKSASSDSHNDYFSQSY